MAPRPLFDSLDYSLLRYSEVTPALSFAAKTKDQALTWQKTLRAKLAELLGPMPAPGPLEVREGRVERFDRYTRQSVVFRSRPGLDVFGWLLRPTPKATGPRAAMLCLPGHGLGVDDIVGIEPDGSTRTTYGGYYQNDFAVRAVHHGYVTLAIEQLGFGRRRDTIARRGGPGNASCQPASGAALLLGETMIGWRVYDAMRALDYLQSRGDVDAARLGAMGISGGGTTTFHLACLDERVQAAMVSGYFNTFKACIFSIGHCMDNYVPTMLHWAEMYDLAGLIAPRAMFCESGTADDIFPVKATRESFARAQAIFRVFGAEEQLGLQIFRGRHQFDGRKCWSFLKERLQG